ncbi:hypothetical protein [Clostridium cochlearium]|uniref:Murein lipoprotein n=1 Tax=Clostridium cochlearium TaxID=1494 RepID=A0A2X2VYX2_CLOCO|nr:hypothetical protein [Clostridium cochlearium]MBU5269227.1 hypothetical protein [Clostridium cochlearium]SQB36202.1 murein lipoprotein [Clostridium cochlearium]
MDPILKEILEKLNKIEENQYTTNNRLTNIESDVSTLKSNMSTLKSDVSTLKSDVNKLKSDVTTLKSDVNDLKEGQIRIEKMFEDLESKNATRHTEILSKIDNLSEDLTLVELVSSKNATDIAKLKLIK